MRPVYPIPPVHWNYQANLSFQPYKIPVIYGGGGAVVRKSKVKQVAIADPIETAEISNDAKDENKADDDGDDE